MNEAMRHINELKQIQAYKALTPFQRKCHDLSRIALAIFLIVFQMLFIGIGLTFWYLVFMALYNLAFP